MNLQEVLTAEKQRVAVRKAEISAIRAGLDLEERGMDMAMHRLVEVTLQHMIQTTIPEPRFPLNPQVAPPA